MSNEHGSIFGAENPEGEGYVPTFGDIVLDKLMSMRGKVVQVDDVNHKLWFIEVEAAENMNESGITPPRHERFFSQVEKIED
jgi:hypothetical protein